MSKKSGKAKKTTVAKRDGKADKGAGEAKAPKADSKKVNKIDLKKYPDPTNRYMKSLAVTLSPADKDKRSKEAAKVYDEIEQIKMAKKLAGEQHNSEIKEHDARLKVLMNIAKTGKEDREVKVCVVADVRSNQVLTVIEATGEVIERRTMTADEKRAAEPKKPGTVTKLGLVKDTDDGKKGTHTEADKERAAKNGKAQAATDGKTASAADDSDEDDDAGVVAHSKRGTAEDIEPDGGDF